MVNESIPIFHRKSEEKETKCNLNGLHKPKQGSKEPNPLSHSKSSNRLWDQDLILLKDMEPTGLCGTHRSRGCNPLKMSNCRHPGCLADLLCRRNPTVIVNFHSVEPEALLLFGSASHLADAKGISSAPPLWGRHSLSCLGIVTSSWKRLMCKLGGTTSRSQ